MGYETHLSVFFHCNDRDELARVARTHLEKDYDECPEAKQFLEFIAAGKGTNYGPKGSGVFAWGIIENYTRHEQFIKILAPFWIDALNAYGMSLFSHIIVFSQGESAGVQAYEICLDYPGSGEIKITKHRCPFSWFAV